MGLVDRMYRSRAAWRLKVARLRSALRRIDQKYARMFRLKRKPRFERLAERHAQFTRLDESCS